MVRSTKIQIIPPADRRQEILDSIRLYRHVCRQIFAASALAEIAGGTIGWSEKNGEKFLNISTERESIKNLLKEVYGGEHSLHLYELRNFVRSDLAPNFLSFVWDSARRDVSSRWIARDPEIKATRGWLTVQGARGLAFFNHIGIGCPRATARPDLHEHCLNIKWDHSIGSVEFKIPKLDGGRYVIWKNLRDNTEGWRLGTIYLNERDGKCFLVVSYERPDPVADIDNSRILTVTVNEAHEEYITASCENKRFTGEKVSVVDALNWLARLDCVRLRYERQLAAAGRDKKSRAVIVKKLNSLTEKRANGQKTFNHLWTRRLVAHAVRTGCGTIVVQRMPEREMAGHPWGWNQFENFLRYKISEFGGDLKIV
jgi:hypothetical protein